MACTLVGSVGTVLVGAAGAAVTPSWGAGSSQATGNLLVCWVGGTATSATPNPATPTNWGAVFAGAAGSCGVNIFYKVATGADAAPTIALQSAVTWSVQLGEFSGLSGALDQVTFGTTGTTSPLVVTLGSPDLTTGELLLYASAARYSAAATKTLANTLNNATAVSTNNNGVSSGSHYDFGYGITTAHSADSDSFSLTTTNLTRGALTIASLQLSAGLFSSGTVNELPGFAGNIPGIA